MTPFHQIRGFAVSSIISSLTAGTFLALVLSPSTTFQTTDSDPIIETSTSREGSNTTWTIQPMTSSGEERDEDYSEDPIETAPIETRLDSPVNTQPIVTPIITPTTVIPLPRIIERDGNEVSIPAVVPAEVKPIQDITSTVSTIRTKVDESKEMLRVIVNDRIEAALRDNGIVPTPKNTSILNALREAIVRDIGSSVATTTTVLPVRTQELKSKITENLKKIDKIASEIKVSASTTSSVRPTTESGTEDRESSTPIDNRFATRTSTQTNTNNLDQNPTGEDRSENVAERPIETVIRNRELPTPAESARQINRLIDGLAETVTTQSKAFKEQGGELLFRDSNEDGISDYESVHLYGIDPIAPAPVSIYEGKSITPEEKILLGFDPAKIELVKIAYEEPKESPFITPAYTVEDMKLTPEKSVEIKGRALPNSFVTLYIYSTPIIVTVKTDEHGEWKYTLDKELENGQHTMYTASVSNSGKILARSSPVLFVKTAEAATIEELFVATPIDAEPRVLGGRDIFFIVTAVIGLILITINIIGARSKEMPPTSTT